MRKLKDEHVKNKTRFMNDFFHMTTVIRKSLDYRKDTNKTGVLLPVLS